MMDKWAEFNALTDFLTKQPTIKDFQILAYHECEPALGEKYSERDERANGMVLVHKHTKLLWKTLYKGQSGRRYFKDWKYRIYIE
jgi:hypothetical protein